MKQDLLNDIQKIKQKKVELNEYLNSTTSQLSTLQLEIENHLKPNELVASINNSDKYLFLLPVT